MTDNVLRERLKMQHYNFQNSINFSLQSSEEYALDSRDISSETKLSCEQVDNDSQFDASPSNIECNGDKDNCSPSLMDNEETLEDDTVKKDPIKENNFKNSSVVKKKGERYLPHFKSEVVLYALQYSIKEAALYYNVNKGTVSDWMRESNRSSVSHSKTEISPDIEFIKWLSHIRQEGITLNKEILKNKIGELIKLYQKLAVNKSNQWFYNYCKRFENKDSLPRSPIMYPISFKLEVVLFCKNLSKKLLSDLFNIDRKRIRDWYQLFNKGCLKKVKRKAESYLTDEKIDKEIWHWYLSQSAKPSSKQVREKGTELYSTAGFTGVKCSVGWFHRWYRRYSLPSAGYLRNQKDVKLLEWLLTELDRNKSVPFVKLKTKAVELWGPNMKPSTSWAIRFSKRYASLLQNIPGLNAELPNTLEEKICHFKNDFSKFAITKNLKSYNLIAVDEIPLNFTPSANGPKVPKSLIRKSGFENCLASVIISCSSDGNLLPSALVLKSSLENLLEDNSIVVLNEASAVIDEAVFYSWFSEIFKDMTGPMVIICDDFEPHVHLKECYKHFLQEKQIEVMLIPGGCNSKLLPISFNLTENFKEEIEKQWSEWNHENCWSSVNRCSVSPSERDIYNWVKAAHTHIALTQREQIQEGFIKAGYMLSN